MMKEGKSGQIFAEQLQHISTRPLPVYTASWGNGLSRPVELPEHFDSRIDTEHVFMFSIHPTTGENLPFYVTSRPCTNCSKVKQVCSRTRPTCVRCQAGGKACVWREGFSVVRGLNCQKTTLKRVVGLDDAVLGSTLKRSRLDVDVPCCATLRTQLVVTEKTGYSMDELVTAASHDNVTVSGHEMKSVAVITSTLVQSPFQLPSENITPGKRVHVPEPPTSRNCSVKSAEGLLRKSVHVATSILPPKQQLSGDSTNAPSALKFVEGAHAASFDASDPASSDIHEREQNSFSVTSSTFPADPIKQGRGRLYLRDLTRDYPKAAVEYGSQAQSKTEYQHIIACNTRHMLASFAAAPTGSI